MNRPPDWAELAHDIAAQDGPLDILVVTNTHWAARDVVAPAMLKRLPPNAVFNLGRMTITFRANLGTSRIHFLPIKSPDDAARIRGMRFDLIFFDPVWDGLEEWRLDLMCYYRKPYAGR